MKSRVAKRKKSRRPAATSVAERPAEALAPTPPPAPPDSAQPPQAASTVPAVMESEHIAKVRKLPKNSLIRRKALTIVAMRLEGKSNEEIATALEISQRSINQYLWMAGKNGWLPAKRGLADPKDTLEFDLAHDVLSNLRDAMADDTRNQKTGVKVRTEVALEVAKGTIFKRFGEANAAPPPSTVLALRIEMPVGVAVNVREGTTGGTGRWQEAEVVEDGAS